MVINININYNQQRAIVNALKLVEEELTRREHQTMPVVLERDGDYQSLKATRYHLKLLIGRINYAKEQ